MLIPPNLSLDPPSPSGESPTSSILSANAWPQPPPVHPYARSGSPTSVRSSVTSSVTVGRADPVAPPRMRTDLPFSVDGPSVQSVPFVAQAPRRSTSSHQPRGRSQHRSPPRLAKSKKSAQDVIYMTVVKETVVGDS
ncbi:hypothetical protein BV25DRAFT_978521 [Artomyces pyxidatus]|uniref:Uncharacterized protein n=1 Tax=Artomyces pyxidatus TaxID=48021 RepID=A0ACB8SV47_9AGAM|nr:hypothetical protein BV25DRAFT_978521 [Artomyces pyxidatus]